MQFSKTDVGGGGPSLDPIEVSSLIKLLTASWYVIVKGTLSLSRYGGTSH